MKQQHHEPVWGPYSKKYMGISRIAEHMFTDGVRFDFTTIPAITGGDIRIPNVTVRSGCHPWYCAEDYRMFTYRYDLEGKEEVYAEVSYIKLDAESVLVCTKFVNNSEFKQNCLINYFSSIEYPSKYYCALTLPEKCEYKDARDYISYEYASKRPWDGQSSDGFKKGEFADIRFVDGFGLGDRANKWHVPHKKIPAFGAEKGDRVELVIECQQAYTDAVLAIRYRTRGNQAADFLYNGTSITFLPCDDLQIMEIAIGAVKAGAFSVVLEGLGTGAAEFDFFCITEKADVHEIQTKMCEYSCKPEITEKRCEKGFISACTYEHIDGAFTLRTFHENTRYRHIETGTLEDCIPSRLVNPSETEDDVTKSFTSAFSRKHSDDGFFHNTIVHTLLIEPSSEHIEYAVLSKNAVNYLKPEAYEKIYEEAMQKTTPVLLHTSGKQYEQSCEILKAALLTNVVYPIYKHGEYIIHHTPGKCWDSLYTWDSGFIGLGMHECAKEWAWYSLDTYLSQEDNPDYAFLHHGSVVPVQIYLWLEMLQREQEKQALLELYPRVKLYYDFLVGKIRNSTMAKFQSGLLTTYDYFYSASGMDDYPAQAAMIRKNMRENAAPVISTAQAIRCGKILQMAAVKLGKKEDVSDYEQDIQRLTKALQTYAWDEESGYFGYALHRDTYEPAGEILRTETEENFNKGLDGIYPIIACACNDEQTKAILEHLKNPKELWSPYGISAVDMSAGYFKVNGYWNGNVWFPHQWFIWKTMLDLGEGAFAFQIAKTALDIWQKEVDHSYDTCEYISIATGRRGGFHHFSGLSAPIMIWANAYYQSGIFHCGFDTWTDQITFSENNTFMQAELTYFGERPQFTVIAGMNEHTNKGYVVTLDGKEIPYLEREKGTLEITLSIQDHEVHTLCIRE